MPRLVRIPHCTHVLFAQVRGAILAHAPWAIRNDIYDRDTDTGYLFFEDSDYIPFLLAPFIVNPPFDKTAMAQALASVSAELEVIQKELGWVE